jgi:periplasmic mercuric ion binding protein
MKTVMLSLFLLISGLVIAGGGEETLTVKTSAKCGMCKMRLEKDLSLAKGVKKATLNLEDKKMTIVYNKKKTNAGKLKKVISMVGYDADEVLADQKSHDALPGCCRKDAKEHLN